MIGYTSLGLVLLIVGTVRSFLNINIDFEEWKNQLENGNKEEMSDKVDFYLYTRQTRDDPLRSRVDDPKLFGGKMNVRKPTKLLIHGYLSHKDRGFSKNMREALLNKGDFNVINVDWSKDAHSLYNSARDDVPAVGKVVAKFIDRLIRELRLKPDNLHVIGHSLGAHISGIAGLNVQSGALRRVTGLDPAGPLFSYNDKERLMPQSAVFVDVIHTCGNSLGFLGELGHVDFYPNEGTPGQPGCPPSMGVCSHGRAIDYFIESLSNPNAFLGRKCDDWKSYTRGECDNNPSAVMGESVPLNARGKYWLKTGESSPFGLNNNARSYKKFTRQRS